MKEAAIQELLDQCLLTEEEMTLGPDKWKETMEDEESIVLELDDGASFNGDAGAEDSRRKWWKLTETRTTRES